MKILFTGGGTGGHFYPLIAIAEKVNNIIDEKKILKATLYYMSDSPFDRDALHENRMVFERVETGKLRAYFSIQNLFDIIKTFFAALIALFKVYSIFPDVVVGKGGYASFPALFAARILRIPVVIHESDTVPGRVNRWAGKFAERVAVSYEEAGKYFPEEKVAWTGQPIRTKIQKPAKEGIYEYLKLDPTVPVIVIFGGSQGAESLNNVVLEALPELVGKYQIIHQVGKKNVDEINGRISVILKDNPNKDRYRIFGFLNVLATKMAAGAASLILSRAGSMLFEIASWGVPSIIIPLPASHANHQLKNAFSYARSGGCLVIEEANLSSNILVQEIDKLMEDEGKREAMSKAAEAFVKPDAADTIAREIVRIALEHEK